MILRWVLLETCLVTVILIQIVSPGTVVTPETPLTDGGKEGEREDGGEGEGLGREHERRRIRMCPPDLDYLPSFVKLLET